MKFVKAENSITSQKNKCFCSEKCKYFYRTNFSMRNSSCRKKHYVEKHNELSNKKSTRPVTGWHLEWMNWEYISCSRNTHTTTLPLDFYLWLLDFLWLNEKLWVIVYTVLWFWYELFLFLSTRKGFISYSTFLLLFFCGMKLHNSASSQRKVNMHHTF